MKTPPPKPNPKPKPKTPPKGLAMPLPKKNNSKKFYEETKPPKAAPPKGGMKKDATEYNAKGGAKGAPRWKSSDADFPDWKSRRLDPMGKKRSLDPKSQPKARRTVPRGIPKIVGRKPRRLGGA